MSHSSSLPKQPYDERPLEPAETAAWKQEVNERLAAHRNRRGGPQETAAPRASESTRAASGKAAEAAARVAARYAKAPSYNQFLAGEARAVVRAAGAAAEAALHAQAAAEAVLAGLESAPLAPGLWQPAPPPAPRLSSAHHHPEVLAQTKPVVAHAAPAPIPALAEPAATAAPLPAPRWLDEPPAAPSPASSPSTATRETPWAGAQPRWEETLPLPTSAAGSAAGFAEAWHVDSDPWADMRLQPAPEGSEFQYDSRAMEEDEEWFSAGPSGLQQDPLSRATVEPVQHLPANLIEFPRELIAPRKARPQLAEAPIRRAVADDPQLNIFEVDPELLAQSAVLGEAVTVAPPGWASIELEDVPEQPYFESEEASRIYATVLPVEAYAVEEKLATTLPAILDPHEFEELEVAPAELHEQLSTQSDPHLLRESLAAPLPAAELIVAPMLDRMLASVVDGALITLASVAASVVVLASTAHPPSGRIAVIAASCGWMMFWLLYQFLFLSYAEEGTPGMRYARIALCTFDDDNPTVAQMRKRIPAMLLSSLPAGLGLAWAVFDKDHLGWHDRLTKTYQRKY